MVVRKTFQWCLLILISLVITGGSYGYYLWMRSDDMIKAGILEKIENHVPGLMIDIDRAQFDFRRRVRVEGCRVQTVNHPDTIIDLPEVVVTLNQEKLARQQLIDVQKIVLNRPQLVLVRMADGTWNWEGLPEATKSDNPLPELIIERGSLSLKFEHGPQNVPTVITLQNLDLRLIPSGTSRYEIEGHTSIPQAGKLEIAGYWDLDSKLGAVSGKWSQLEFGPNLVRLATGISPELESQLKKAFPSLQLRPNQATGMYDLGVSAQMDIQFSLSRTTRDQSPQFQVLTHLREGKFKHPLLPFPLRNIVGKVLVDNESLQIQKLQAYNGETSFTVGGDYYFNQRFSQAGAPLNQSSFSFQAHQLPLDERLRSRLTGGLARTYDTLRPSGNIDMEVDLSYPGTGKWRIQNLKVMANDGEVVPVHFPYRVDHIKGTLVQQDPDILNLNFSGMAGDRPVTAKGYVEHPGPASKIEIFTEIQQVPIDASLRAACPDGIKAVLDELDLQGKANAIVKMTRAPALHQPIQLDMLAKMESGGALQYRNFPYRVTDLTGVVSYSSKTGRVSFSELQGMHGNARLSAQGAYDRFANDGKLKLSVSAENAVCDSNLRLALPDSLQKLWGDLSPTGKLNLTTDILWERGKPAEIRIPRAHWWDGSLNLKDFPYPIDNFNAKWNYEVDPNTGNSVVLLKSISGKHDETQIRIGNAFAEITPRGDWRFKMEDMNIDDISADRAFQSALPEAMGSALNILNIQRPISASGWIEFRGSQEPGTAITAAWGMNTYLAENSVTAGVDVAKVYGKVHSQGTWDGTHLQLTGDLDLDSAVILGYHLTELKGPFEINDTQLTVGSRQIRREPMQSVSLPQINAKQPITAKAIRGVITCMGDIELSAVPTYNMQIELHRGLLEEYAARYMPGESQLRGVMNGWIQLWGRGSNKSDLKGQGQLQISPAAIYELPPIAQIFKVVRLAQPDKTAFDSAFCDFTVSNQTFHLKYIELKGNAISLYGQAGEAHFDGRLKVDLFSQLTRRQLPLPAITQLIGHATSGWIRVELRGTTSSPIVDIKSNPLLDGSLKTFLNNVIRGRPMNNNATNRWPRGSQSESRSLRQQFPLPLVQ
ncbi:hypothetical protein Enr10x_14060 [Gimesia panareensis]|uniref:AsmA-like C-terminal domain-containing protein n=1 Tax=Gimesia panareensis TaxID=2527978 RepID=A0A517Q398_9PLAN|nr:hypothetical protein [Gimesia panareensis]QDT26107.1 hypothetical protein Enr10x_14060 [Gimesia panareensis]